MGVIHGCDVFVRYPGSIFNEMIRSIFLFLFLFLFLFKSMCTKKYNAIVFAYYYYYSHVFSLPYEYVVVVDDAPTDLPTNAPMNTPTTNVYACDMYIEKESRRLINIVDCCCHQHRR